MSDSSYLLYSIENSLINFQSKDYETRSKRDFVKKIHADQKKYDFSLTKLPAYDERTAGIRREIALPRLIAISPEEIADPSPAARRRVVRRLARALRGERARGRAGHWSYSLNRHIGLLQAFRAELAMVRALFPRTLVADSGPTRAGRAQQD